MLSYVIRRILLLFPTLLGITAVVFAFLAFAPGGISGALISKDGQMKPNERKEKEDYLEKRYGLRKPKVVQYFRWMNKVSPIGFETYRDSDPEVIAAVAAAEKLPNLPNGKRPVADPYTGDMRLNKPTFKWPDLGRSYTKGRPVSVLIAESLPVTLLLNLVSLPIVYILAIGSGVKAAKNPGGFFDVGSGTTLLGLWSVPVILAGTLCLGFFTDERYVQAFPTTGLHDIASEKWAFLPHWTVSGFERGYLLDTLWHLTLPLICMSYVSFAYLSKLARGSVLDNKSTEYARTARAKGLSNDDVLYRHVFRNSLLPLITVAAGLLPELIAGTVIVETIFGIPGMGRLAVEASSQRDPELTLTITLIGGLLGLAGNLLADICYAVADPRVSYDG